MAFENNSLTFTKPETMHRFLFVMTSLKGGYLATRLYERAKKEGLTDTFFHNYELDSLNSQSDEWNQEINASGSFVGEQIWKMLLEHEWGIQYLHHGTHPADQVMGRFLSALSYCADNWHHEQIYG